MTKKTNAADFDFAEWIGGGSVPEESIDIFTATNLVGEINALTRQIQEDDRGRDVEPSLGDEASPEEERLAELLTEYLASKRTVYIKGLQPGELIAIRKAHEASGRPDHDFPERCLSASIVAMRRPRGERTPVNLSLSAVQKMHKQIGDGQMAALFQTYQQATKGIPAVDADFLLRRSGSASTEES